MKPIDKTTVGIRAGNFSNAVLFLTEVLKLEMVHYDTEKAFAQFKLPSGEMMELFGAKHAWHPFTTPPDWELIIADIRRSKEKSQS